MNRNLVAMLAFGVSVLGAIGFVVAYSMDANHAWLGLCVALAAGGMGVGLVTWSDEIDPGPQTEERHPLTSSKEDLAAQREAVERGTEMLGRRTFLLGGLGTAVVSFLAMLIVPIRSLGPAPKNLYSTPWEDGRRLVTRQGVPVKADSMPPDGLLTVYPEGAVEAGDGPVILMRLPDDQLTSKTVEGGSVGGIVAYSKICTHAGCAVGLLQADSRQPLTVHRLLCPCHQSEFDPLDGAQPVAGPAVRSLPQLPLAVDGDGNLVAKGDFSEPVGPGFWRRA